MKTKTDYNSSENQRIKRDFVAREVKTCFSYEMQAILRASSENPRNSQYPLPSYDDIENQYDEVCPDCGNVLDYEGQGECPSCKSNMLDKNVDQQAKEIFEWWIVTEFLYRKLKDKGEPVLEWGNNYYWGRTCSGQAILLDSAISSICAEMEILDDQKYSWNK